MKVVDVTGSIVPCGIDMAIAIPTRDGRRSEGSGDSRGRLSGSGEQSRCVLERNGALLPEEQLAPSSVFFLNLVPIRMPPAGWSAAQCIGSCVLRHVLVGNFGGIRSSLFLFLGHLAFIFGLLPLLLLDCLSR